jgi:hypothetical protein
MSGFDNRLPDDYPVFDPPETAFNPNGKNLIVEVGDFIVNRDGHIAEATTSNKGPYPNEFLRDINEGCFRAKFLTCTDDYLEMANQSRKATKAEIAKAQKWAKGIKHKIEWTGQVRLL